MSEPSRIAVSRAATFADELILEGIIPEESRLDVGLALAVVIDKYLEKQ